MIDKFADNYGADLSIKIVGTPNIKITDNVMTIVGGSVQAALDKIQAGLFPTIDVVYSAIANRMVKAIVTQAESYSGYLQMEWFTGVIDPYFVGCNLSSAGTVSYCSVKRITTTSA